MGKGLGLIGNFKGKVGNVVGYNLKDSNNNQTQGVRIYQPVVRNPKTYAQAEQRARMAVINATYRVLKSIIDRGQEGKPYGNKSRLAWLSDAMKQFGGAWVEKGENIIYPAKVPLTKGSLPGITLNGVNESEITFGWVLSEDAPIATFGNISAIAKAGQSTIKDGDQITIVIVDGQDGALGANVISFVVDETDNTPATVFSKDGTQLILTTDGLNDGNTIAVAVILSREGADGSHLRSTTALQLALEYFNKPPYDDASKEAAIRSYMASGSTSDWPQVPDENA